jgi:protein-S-isoprenylcysteine O-methyltransferase Ste14
MRLFIRLLIYETVLAALLFVSAGRVDLPWFWAFILVHFALSVVALRNLDPDLIKERLKPGPGGQDRGLRWLILPFYAAHFMAAGLDVGRFHWSGRLVPVIQAAGLVVFASGMGVMVWAMAMNRFFSPVVRIQGERGHRLVTSGPYRYVRHPGYTGSILLFLGSGPALGSWWSLVPLIPVLALILRRTVLEDQFLKRELVGYDRYAERVRSRLVPGVW